MMTRTLRGLAAAIAVLAATVHADNLTAEVSAAATAAWPTEVREGVFSFFPEEIGEDDQTSADGPGRRSLFRTLASSGSWFSDEAEVRQGLEKGCDAILWGKEVSRNKVRRLLSNKAVDYFSGDSAAVRQWLTSQVDLSMDTSTSNIVMFLVGGGQLDLTSGQMEGGVATFSKWSTQCRFCVNGTIYGYDCDKCGKWLEPKPLAFQPFICVNYKPGSPHMPREIRLVDDSLDKNLCMDYNYYTMNTYMYTCHGDTNQKWYMPSDGTMRSPKDDSLCLDMHLETKNVYSVPCHGGQNQKWTFSQGRIRNAYDPSKCLDMDTDIHNLYMGECHLGWTQFFRWA